MYELLKHPEAYAAVRAEVDAVLGKERVQPGHLAKLTYLNGAFSRTRRPRR